MKSIWKFPLQVLDVQDVAMPIGAEILSLQVQPHPMNTGVPCIWALVDPDEPSKCWRTVRIFGTGHPMPDNPGTYIGTFQIYGGAMVFHAFID
jgi:hypothetical protein